jgi:tetratricopeptide (TPR) repeat protein
MRRAWSCLLLMLCLSTPALAARKPNPFLVQAKVHYQGLEFEKCLRRLDQAGRWKQSTRAEQVEIELYSGLCAFNLGNEEEARKSFSLALEMDPKVELPPYSSPRLVTFFDALAQRSLPAEAPDEEAAPAAPPTPAPPAPVQDTPRQVELQPAAPPEPPLLAPAPAAPASKKLLFPVLLSGTSAVAAGGAVYFGLQARSEEDKANDRDTFYEDALAHRDDARQNAKLANVAIGVAATAAVGALLTYVLQ